MNSLSTGLLRALRRVESALLELPDALTSIRELLYRLRKPVRRPRRPRKPLQAIPEGLGRALPAPPKAKPLLAKLRGRVGKIPPPTPPSPALASLARVPDDPLGEQARQAMGARSLLLEIIRRAAFDWVRYRNSRRMDHKLLAEDAFTWIFLEDENHPHWKIRAKEGKELTSFLSICEQLDIDAERLRKHVRLLTLERVMSSGRPPENSRPGEHLPDIEIHTSVPDNRLSVYEFDSLVLPDFD